MRAAGTFLVERYVPRLTQVDVEALAERLAAACAELRTEGREIRWRRSLGLLDDETCLCIFTARTRADIEEANHRASAPYDRIVQTLAIEDDPMH